MLFHHFGTKKSFLFNRLCLNENRFSASTLLTLKYQVDLWGEQFLARKASKFQLEAARGELDGVATTVAAQIAEAYYDVIAAKAQEHIVRKQVDLNKTLLDLLELRYEGTTSKATDVFQQRQQLATTRTRLPQAQSFSREARQRMAVLLSVSLSSITVDLQSMEGTEIPALPEPPPTGNPRDLLQKRPDLRSARERLNATREQHKRVARAALPSISINAHGGGQWFRGQDFRGQGVYGFGVNLSIPFVKIYTNFSRVREVESQMISAELELHQALIEAVSEVENAIASEKEQEAQVVAFELALEAAERSFQISRESYIAGIQPYNIVITALNALQQVELSLLKARRALPSARIQLYHSLGGRWTKGLATHFSSLHRNGGSQ